MSAGITCRNELYNDGGEYRLTHAESLEQYCSDVDQWKSVYFRIALIECDSWYVASTNLMPFGDTRIISEDIGDHYAERLIDMGLVEEVVEKHTGVAYVMPVCPECGSIHVKLAYMDDDGYPIGWRPYCRECNNYFSNSYFDVDKDPKVAIKRTCPDFSGAADHIPDTTKMAYPKGSFMWAMGNMLIGKSARRPGWASNTYWVIDGSGFLAAASDNELSGIHASGENIFATDWEIAK